MDDDKIKQYVESFPKTEDGKRIVPAVLIRVGLANMMMEVMGLYQKKLITEEEGNKFLDVVESILDSMDGEGGSVDLSGRIQEVIDIVLEYRKRGMN